MQELQQRQRDEDLRAQLEKIEQLVDEMERIRSANASQKVKKENSALISKDYEDLTISMNRIAVTLKDVNERLKESKRDLSSMKEEQHTEADSMVASIERAKKECGAAFADNNTLLSKMLEVEKELDEAMDGQLYGNNGASKLAVQSDAELDELEIRSTKQLQDCRARKKQLEDRVGASSDLREQLRAKHEEYRVLKRDMSEVAKIKSLSKSYSPPKSSYK
jgi:hypothetical protein